MIDLQIDNNNGKFQELLKKVSFRFPVAEISRKTGYGKSQVSKFLNEKADVSDEFLKKFADAYDLNLEDFEEKDYAHNEEEQSSVSESATAYSTKRTGYYLPDVSASAGLEKNLNNDELNKIPVIIPGWGNDLLFINVFGDSMYPKYNAGEIIGVKPIEFQYLNYGYPYVIVLTNGDVYIKIVQPGTDKDHLVLESVNAFYKPKEFHLEQIKSFYSIKGVIKKEMM